MTVRTGETDTILERVRLARVATHCLRLFQDRSLAALTRQKGLGITTVESNSERLVSVGTDAVRKKAPPLGHPPLPQGGLGSSTEITWQQLPP